MTHLIRNNGVWEPAPPGMCETIAWAMELRPENFEGVAVARPICATCGGKGVVWVELGDVSGLGVCECQREG
jgi:hypothetical protein